MLQLKFGVDLHSCPREFTYSFEMCSSCTCWTQRMRTIPSIYFVSYPICVFHQYAKWVGSIFWINFFCIVSGGDSKGYTMGSDLCFCYTSFISPDDLSIFMINILAVDVFVILLFDDPWLGVMVFYLSFFHPLVIPGGCLLYYSNLSYIIILYCTCLYFIHSLPYVPICSFQLFI